MDHHLGCRCRNPPDEHPELFHWANSSCIPVAEADPPHRGDYGSIADCALTIVCNRRRRDDREGLESGRVGQRGR